jgi:hypothetical protein
LTVNLEALQDRVAALEREVAELRSRRARAEVTAHVPVEALLKELVGLMRSELDDQKTPKTRKAPAKKTTGRPKS